MMGWKEPKVYAVQHLKKDIVAVSRSGGIFTALSDHILSKGGAVYGCVLTADFKAVHVRTEDEAGRNTMRGSKYIQSKLGDTFKSVKIDLEAGYEVLFSGTSCQVAGLKKFLGQEYTNLFCVDIVCHGVPSTVVWKKYLVWQEQRAKAKVVSVDFRNKKDFGWHSHIETLNFDNGKKVSSSIFRNLFYGHTILRPSCYECPFKSVMHPSDITIADYWGIEKAAPEFDDDKGASLVLINNENGFNVFEAVKDNLRWKETRLEDSLQPPLKAPFPKPKDRGQFWQDFQSKNFGYVTKKYARVGLMNKIKGLLRKVKQKILK